MDISSNKLERLLMERRERGKKKRKISREKLNLFKQWHKTLPAIRRNYVKTKIDNMQQNSIYRLC